MAVTIFKTYSSGEVLTASDLNSSFSKIHDNGEDLGWPATKDKAMGGFKLTGMGVGSAQNDSATLRQVQAEAYIWCGTAGGTANAITLTPSPAIAAYVAGQRFVWIAGASLNTGGVTVAISGLTTKTMENDGYALAPGDHAASKMYMGVYDGTVLQIARFRVGNNRRNIIVNGEGLIQQRVDYTLVKDVYGIGPDRFAGMATGTLVTAGTLTRTDSASVGVSGSSHKFAGVTLTGTGTLFHRHRLDAIDSIGFQNQTVTVSVKVYHDIGSAKTFTLYVRKANAPGDFSSITAIADDGGTSVPNTTATTLTFTVFNMGDCSNGIELLLKVETGAITTKNVELTNWEFTLGAISPVYRPSLISLTYAGSRRFTQVFDGALTGEWLSATSVLLHGRCSPTMRGVPTLTLVDNSPTVNEFGVATRTGSGSSIVAFVAAADGFFVQIDGFSSATAGNQAVGANSGPIILAVSEL